MIPDGICPTPVISRSWFCLAPSNSWTRLICQRDMFTRYCGFALCLAFIFVKYRYSPQAMNAIIFPCLSTLFPIVLMYQTPGPLSLNSKFFFVRVQLSHVKRVQKQLRTHFVQKDAFHPSIMVLPTKFSEIFQAFIFIHSIL